MNNPEERPFASYQWWKSFFLDDTAAAARLARWGETRILLHYGGRDPRVPPAM